MVFTQGCNYNCPFCHNRQLLDRGGPIRDSTEIFNFLRNRRGFIDGLVITGGEPCIQQGLADFCSEIKALGVAVKLDTNGSRPERLRTLLKRGLLDYVAMDLKAPLAKYDLLCGRPVDTQAVERSVELLIGSTVEVEFRTTTVPALLNESDLYEIGATIQGRAPYYLQRYVKSKSTRPVASAEPEQLNLASVLATLDRKFGQTYLR